MQVARSLAFELKHAHAGPPTRAATRSGAAEDADYGLLLGS